MKRIVIRIENKRGGWKDVPLELTEEEGRELERVDERKLLLFLKRGLERWMRGRRDESLSTFDKV